MEPRSRPPIHRVKTKVDAPKYNDEKTYSKGISKWWKCFGEKEKTQIQNSPIIEEVSPPILEKYIHVRSVKSIKGIDDDEEDTELINKEEAVCRFCFHPMKEEDNNILMTKCRCPLTLMHADCANTSWSTATNCHVCKHQIRTVVVTISIKDQIQNHKSTPTEINNKKHCNYISCI